MGLTWCLQGPICLPGVDLGSKSPPGMPGVVLVPGLAAALGLTPEKPPRGQTQDPDNRQGLNPPSSPPTPADLSLQGVPPPPGPGPFKLPGLTWWLQGPIHLHGVDLVAAGPQSLAWG